MDHIKLWQAAATILSFTALALIVFVYWIGLETWYHYTIVIICSVFFAVGVTWWYWALNQIANFAIYIRSLKTTIQELKDDLKDVKKDL